ncbi:MAG: efflux RND transporter permease subunit [Proteobacteria bacterium]|nr:efflux RND transporter permease subunit [Pseudomonadota bacterium]
MILSDVSIRRPVFASVISLVVVIFGLFAFQRLSVREYPNIDPPIISVTTNYRGASANVIEVKVTQILEDSISGIEGVRTIVSSSREGSSSISVEFFLNRDIEAATSDIRDKVGRVLSKLPTEADPPVIAKVEADARPILWGSLSSDNLVGLELTDYAKRFLVDRLSNIAGVSAVRIGGERRYSMRIWLDRQSLAARSLTVQDVENSLRRQNIELPAGRIESSNREFTVRTDTGLKTPDQFRNVIVAVQQGYPVKLGELAKVELAAEDLRGEIRNNGRSAVGIGIVKQSTANTLEVADKVKALFELMRPTLPPGVSIDISFDTSLFVAQSIHEVFLALGIALALVVGVIFVFLRSFKATLIPAISIPVAIIGAMMVIAGYGYSLNVLTLLALVLAIGLVVDDAIVVLENIHRHIEEGMPPLLAAVRGAQQIGFAVVSTTLVLIAVFVPISFLPGNIGRLFSEFGISVAACVLFSGMVALSLTPMLCSKMLTPVESEGLLHKLTEPVFQGMTTGYHRLLGAALRAPVIVMALGLATSLSAIGLFNMLQKEFSPIEDRGFFLIQVVAPEGSSINYTRDNVIEVEKILKPLVDDGTALRVFANIAPSFGRPGDVKQAFITVRLKPWSERTRKQQDIVRGLFAKLNGMPGVRAVAINQPSLGQFFQQPVQVVLGGSSYEELVGWRDALMDRMRQNPGLQNISADYDPTKPQLRVVIDRARAADQGVAIDELGRTLETMLGGRIVTTFSDRGDEYNVIVQTSAENRAQPRDLTNIFVRSQTTRTLVPLNSLVTLRDVADAAELNRVDRLRSVTILSSLAPGYSLGEALSFVEQVVASELPPQARLTYKGESREFRESTSALYFTFGMALIVVFLVLAAQFESWIHPLVIMLTVPLAVTGALGGIWFSGVTLNVYSQIGMIMLVGIVAKNGILIVEFSNQLRAGGKAVTAAVHEAAVIRLRPILMTSIATAFSALPLAYATGAGAESRQAIGVVVVFGVLFATLLTLFVVPVFYSLLAGYTKPSSHVSDLINRLEHGERRGEAPAHAAPAHGTPQPGPAPAE